MLDPASAPTGAGTHEFAPTQVRYIKLGEGGGWAHRAFAEGIIPIGFGEVSHAPCAAGDWAAVRAELLAANYRPSTVTNWTRELRAFYELDERCLWWTIADGHLHWAFAQPGVIAVEDAAPGEPLRYRRTVDDWHRSDLGGTPLTTRSLSSALLRTASYRMTICEVEHEAYLLRRIRGERDPLHIAASALQVQLADVAEQMIRQLDWRDFEVLIDLIFARGGWQRRSAMGKGEVDDDLLLTMPTTGELAWVQVKSRASQAVLDDYLARFDRDGSCQHFFFVCHTASSALALPDRPGLHLWTGASLAAATIAAGLFDWLVEQTR